MPQDFVAKVLSLNFFFVTKFLVARFWFLLRFLLLQFYYWIFVVRNSVSLKLKVYYRTCYQYLSLKFYCRFRFINWLLPFPDLYFIGGAWSDSYWAQWRITDGAQGVLWLREQQKVKYKCLFIWFIIYLMFLWSYIILSFVFRYPGWRVT